MEQIGQLVPRVAGEMRGEDGRKDAMMEEVGLLYFSDSLPFLHRRDIALQAHLLKNLLHTQKRAVRIQKWVAPIGRAGNTGEHGSLGNIELRRGGCFPLIPETQNRKSGRLGPVGF